MKSKILALSAISSAFITIILTLGSYVEIADLSCIILASVFVTLPLYLKSYKGCFLAYIAGGVLALICSLPTITFSVTLPAYALFSGLYPIIKNILTDKGVNKYVNLIIGLIWCVLACYGVYFYYTSVTNLSINNLPKFIFDYILFFVGLMGVAFYFVYDKFLNVTKYVIDKNLGKIIK